MRIRRKLAFLTVLAALTLGGASVNGDCWPQIGFVCGKSCGDYFCNLPADPDILCVEIPGGCGGGLPRPDCCPM